MHAPASAAFVCGFLACSDQAFLQLAIPVSKVGRAAAGTLSWTQVSYALRNVSHSGTPISLVLLAVVDVAVVAAGDAAGAVVAGARLVVESDLAQPIKSRAETTKNIKKKFDL